MKNNPAPHQLRAGRSTPALQPVAKAAPDPDFAVAPRLTHVEDQMNELNGACDRLSKAVAGLEDRIGPITYRAPEPAAPVDLGGIPPDTSLAPHANLLRNLQRAINAEASRIEVLNRNIEL